MSITSKTRWIKCNITCFGDEKIVKKIFNVRTATGKVSIKLNSSTHATDNFFLSWVDLFLASRKTLTHTKKNNNNVFFPCDN